MLFVQNAESDLFRKKVLTSQKKTFPQGMLKSHPQKSLSNIGFPHYQHTFPQAVLFIHIQTVENL